MPFLIIQGLSLLSFMLYFLPSALVQHISCMLCVIVAQLCLILCDPMDCSLLGSSVHGILQARVLEWIDISFSRGSSRTKDRNQLSYIAVRLFTIWATREAPCTLLTLFSTFGWYVPVFLSKFIWMFSLTCLSSTKFWWEKETHSECNNPQPSPSFPQYPQSPPTCPFS